MSTPSTSTTGVQKKTITLTELHKMISSLKPPPQILAMEYKVLALVPNQLLPNNTVMLSMDLAKKIGLVD